MSATILDAIQGVATPAMVQSATSLLGLTEGAATAALGAASTNILGALMTQTNDAGLMGKVAALVAGFRPDAGMFANMAGMLAGGLPTSPAHVAGNKLLGLAFGSKSGALMDALVAATKVSPKAASGLTTLAAPMVLAALHSKLGAGATPAGLAGLLGADRNIIAAAMPAGLRTAYGLAAAAMAPAAMAPGAAATAASAPAPMQPGTVAPVTGVPIVAAPVAPSVAATVAPAVAKPMPAAPAPAPAPSPIVAAKPVAPAAAATPMAPPATAPARPMAPAATPAVQTASGHASAPAMAAKPAAPVPASAAPMTSHVDMSPAEASRTSPLALVGLFLPLAILTGLIWYWAYGLDAGKPVISAAKTTAASAPAAPAPEVKKAEPAAAPPSAAALVPTAGANGLVKYTLPGGTVVEVAKDGLESKLLAFIGNKDAAIDNKLWFDFDKLSFVTASSDLTPESKGQVEAAVAILKAYPAVHIKVGGYTDNQGDPDANLKLSDQRAKRVMEEMVAGGIAAERIEAKGYGDQFPIGDNATPEGRAKNRRTALSVRAK